LWFLFPPDSPHRIDSCRAEKKVLGSVFNLSRFVCIPKLNHAWCLLCQHVGGINVGGRYVGGTIDGTFKGTFEGTVVGPGISKFGGVEIG
jgi:hypothetical protein